MRYRNRSEAGRVIARILSTYTNRADVVVLALPRGGVPVAYEVASALNAPLDVFIVRKLGVPGQEELAMGAIASGGAMHKPVQFWWLERMFGSYDGARIVHFLVMIYFVLFLIPHVILVLADGWDTMRSMIVGWSTRLGGAE